MICSRVSHKFLTSNSALSRSRSRRGRKNGATRPSMTSGRGLPTTAAGTARVASASVMDGPDGSER